MTDLNHREINWHGMKHAPTCLRDAETPFLLIEEGRVQANVMRMAERTAQHGVQLRPHIKTHKMPFFAQMQLEHGACGITAAKVSEAEVMVAGGIQDIFIAYPLVTSTKINRALDLMEKARIIIGVDSQVGADALEEIAAERELQVEIRIEIDTGLHRTGTKAATLLSLAAHIVSHCPHLTLTGIYTFRGAMLNGEATLDLRAAGHDEGSMMVRYANMLRDAGHTISDVSVGSSPTGLYAAEVPGVTEIRPGTYIFNDRMQVAFGVATLRDCAATVIVTVVSCPQEDLIVVDGGSKAFATDVQPNSAPLYLDGFGHITGVPYAQLGRLSEEHGMIRVTPGHPFRVGDRIAVIPNHVCSTLNLYDQAWIVGTQPARQLQISARGHSW